MPADLNTTAGVREAIAQVRLFVSALTDPSPSYATAAFIGGYHAKLAEHLNTLLAALPSAGPAPVVGSVEEPSVTVPAWQVKFWREAAEQRRTLWHAINPRGPRCRDCADEDGRCPASGLPCGPQEAALETVAKLRAADALTLPEQATADRAGEDAAPSDAQIIRNAIAAWEEVYPDLPPPKNGEVTRYEDLEFGPLNELRSLANRLQSPNRKDAAA